MKPVRISVATASRTYQVHIGEGLLAKLGPLLDEAGARDRRFIVSSPTVWRAHGRTVERAVHGTHTTLVPDGERSKTMQTVAKIHGA